MKLLVIGLMCFGVSLFSVAEARVWTSKDGKKIEADFVRMDGVLKVVISRKGREFTLPLEKLSDADREWVANQNKGTDAGETGADKPKERVGSMGTLLGVALKPGKNVIPFEFTDEELKEFSEGNREHSRKAQIIVFLPEGFDPKKTQKMMMTTASSSGKASQAGSVGRYSKSGMAAGWMVMTADSEKGRPSDFSVNYRIQMIAGALKRMESEWPEVKTWSLAGGGFSGGAKAIQMMMSYFGSRNGGEWRVVGLFLGGCNENVIDGLKKRSSKMSKGKLRDVAVFMSQGKKDKIATPASGKQVMEGLKDAGLKVQKYEESDGGHSIYGPHLDAAFKWFGEHAAGLKE